MLQSLYIRNYVLIDRLEMEFDSGFTTITGETGAGKSILMGALSLILGKRVDTSVLKLKDAKCIVEGTFQPGESLQEIFRSHELDFEPVTTLRREISPSGKSRAFVNDTPVNLNALRELGNRLVDIHSQHQNLQLNDHLYQMEVVDHLAGLHEELEGYQKTFSAYTVNGRELERLREESSRLKGELDYMQFQYQELESAQLKEGEMQSLETDLQRAEHTEEIRKALYTAAGHLTDETAGILDQLRESLQQLKKITGVFSPAAEWAGRMESAYIELKDLAAEVLAEAGKVDLEPGVLERLQERVDLLYGLMQKHRAGNIDELIALRERLSERIDSLVFSEDRIRELETERGKLRKELEKRADLLHLKRSEAAVELQHKVEPQLRQLGIPNARFSAIVGPSGGFNEFGTDEVRFLFSANKQVDQEEISSVASGGEMSRLMLCIKSLVSGRKGMPTLIFDEIDAGVSGEIADRVGGIMKQLANGRQVIAITHLPQVASRGGEHFTVFKEDTDDATYTRIRKLGNSERVTEIARMLSGKEVTEAALSNARNLLGVQ